MLKEESFPDLHQSDVVSQRCTVSKVYCRYQGNILLFIFSFSVPVDKVLEDLGKIPFSFI
jgi:hypothetical protein